MQRLCKGLYQLEAGDFVNAYLIEGLHGLTLVDTGHSRGAEALVEEIELGGFALKDIEEIVLTSSRFDHAGGAAALVNRRRVKVFARPEDIPVLKGASPPAPAGLARRLAGFLRRRSYPFQALETVVPICQGGVLRALPQWQVLGSPGPTPGSLSLYQPTEGILICGDVFANLRGSLSLGEAEDEAQALSLRRAARALSALACEVLCSGHGPVIRSGASRRVQELLEGEHRA